MLACWIQYINGFSRSHCVGLIIGMASQALSAAGRGAVAPGQANRPMAQCTCVGVKKSRAIVVAGTRLQIGLIVLRW